LKSNSIGRRWLALKRGRRDGRAAAILGESDKVEMKEKKRLEEALLCIWWLWWLWCSRKLAHCHSLPLALHLPRLAPFCFLA